MIKFLLVVLIAIFCWPIALAVAGLCLLFWAGGLLFRLLIAMLKI